jgi:uncharacterized membrane protein
MPSRDIESALKRWTQAGLIDASLAERLRASEATAESFINWPVLLATIFGSVTLGAGVLLFVAAHWDELSPGWRFTLVLALVWLFHAVAGFFVERSPRLNVALHAVGTTALGGGIFLTAQIFNLQEHWPGGIMLWAAGALGAWALLRQWPQALLAALLVPGWLVGEWMVATEHHMGGEWPVAVGVAVLCVSYLTAVRLQDEGSLFRQGLKWIGAIALFPSLMCALDSHHEGSYYYIHQSGVPHQLMVAGWTLSILLPLAFAFLLRKQAAWMNAVAAGWIFVLSLLPAPWRQANTDTAALFILQSLGPLFWEVLGAVGLIAWGLKESSKGRVNLGIVGFALAVISFYFSELMDKLGRSTSLIGLGILLLVGGWLLERTRRRLILRVQGATA